MTKRFVVTQRGLDLNWGFEFDTLEEAELKYDELEVDGFPGVEVVSLEVLLKIKTS